MSTETYEDTDGVIHVIAAEGKVRGLAALTTQVVEEARCRHDLFPTATAALGRTMTAAAMLGAVLKGEEKVMIEIMGDGPLGTVVAEMMAAGELRGYVAQPHVHLPLNNEGKLDVGGAIGKGSFHVTKDLGLREPYRGTVPLITSEIGDDFAYYLGVSEQTPSAVGLGVLVDRDHSVRASGGVLVQLMPGASDDGKLIELVESRMTKMPAVSRAIDEGKRPIDMLMQVLEGLEPKEIGRRDLSFFCRCSKSRFSRGLIALGEEELQALVDEQGDAELVCHFCNERYRFAEEELIALIEEIRQSDRRV